MTDAQILALKKFDERWVVDENFQNELIVYTHRKGVPQIDEYVIALDGKHTKTATYPYTKELQKELLKY